MHRKIPKSRRHKKLKSVDPEYKLKKYKKNDDKFDAKPSDINAQEIPKKCQQLIQITQKLKDNAFLERKPTKKKKSKLITVYGEKKKQEYGMNKPTKSAPESVVQKPYETDNQFINRVSYMASEAVQEAKMEIKYGFKVGYEEDDKIEEDPRILSLLKMDETTNNVSKKKLKRKRKEEMKAEMKRQSQLDRRDDFSHLTDKVAFNEVVDAPPTFSIKGTKFDPVQRKPGKSDLILKSMVPGSKTIDRTGKRKHLPVGERHKIELLREEAIKSYREMKARKRKQT